MQMLEVPGGGARRRRRRRRRPLPRVLLAVLALCSAVPATGAAAAAAAGAAELGFVGLAAAGCLPADFSAPEVRACVREPSPTPLQGAQLYATLDCITQLLGLDSSAGGADLAAFSGVTSAASADAAWRAAERRRLERCADGRPAAALPAAGRGRALYLQVCVAALRRHDCRLSLMQRLPARLGYPADAAAGRTLVDLLDGDCMDSVKSAPSEAAFAACVADSGLQWTAVLAGVNWARRYTQVVADNNGTSLLTLPTEQEVLLTQTQLETLRDAVVCTMRTTGELHADGTVDYTRVTQLISASEGRDELKQLQKDVVASCRRSGHSSAQQFVSCYYESAPAACAALRAHALVSSKGRRADTDPHDDMEHSPEFGTEKGEQHSTTAEEDAEQSVASQLSFERLKDAGCLPEDFSAPEFGPCVEQGAAGDGAFYQALTCVADRFGLSDSSDRLVEQLLALLGTMSSKTAWLSQQQANIELCHDMLSRAVLTSPRQQAAFLLRCAIRVLRHQCRLDVMERYGALLETSDARRAGHHLVRLVDGRCMDSVKNYEGEIAFAGCVREVGLDWDRVTAAIFYTDRYIGEVERGLNVSQAMDALLRRAEPAANVGGRRQRLALARSQAASTWQQLQLLQRAITCTMQATGEWQPDAGVHYPTVFRMISESQGRPELKQLQAAVVEGCQKRGIRSADDFLDCYYESAPFACNSLASHAFVIQNSETLAELAEEEEEEVAGATVRSVLSFAGLRRAGCLPDDFRAPPLGNCLAYGSARGAQLYGALRCVAGRFNISSAAGLQVNQLVGVFNSSSAAGSWRSQQRDNAALCRAMINSSVLATPERQAVFLLACTRRIQQHQCRLGMMTQLAALTGMETAAATGRKLVRIRDGGCMDSVKSAASEAAFARCSAGVGLDWSRILAAISWADGYTRVLVDDDDGGGAAASLPTADDVATAQTQLALLDAAIVCTMRETGELRADGSVDYERAQQLVAGAHGRPQLRQLQSAVLDACQKQGVTSAEAFLKCYYESAPYACNSLHSHVMVLYNGYKFQRQTEEAANRPVSEEVSFSALRDAGCVPDDFEEPDVGACVKRGATGAWQLNQALECIAKRFDVLTESGLQADKLSGLLAGASADAFWAQRQRDNVATCRRMLNATVLRAPRQQAVFLLLCSRRAQQHRCRRRLMQQLGMSVNVAGAASTGERLVSMLDGGCLDGVKHPAHQRAFAQCVRGTEFDWGAVLGAVSWVRGYTRPAAGGGGAALRPAPPSEAELLRTQQQLAMLDDAILCTMRSTGELRPDDSVDFARVLALIADAAGSRYLKDLQASVVQDCRKRGVTSGDEFLNCYLTATPFACDSLASHYQVLSPDDGRRQGSAASSAEGGVSARLSSAALAAAGCLPDDFVEPDFHDCADETDEVGPGVYRALTCLADRYNVSGPSAVNASALYSIINSTSADPAWTSRQRGNVDLCQSMLNSSALTTPPQRAVFLQLCTRRVQRHQCRLQLMQRLQQLQPTLPDAAATGQRLVRILDGNCMDSVKSAAGERAFAECSAATSAAERRLDWHVVTAGLRWAGNYTQLSPPSPPSPVAASLPTAAEAAALRRQLDRLDAAIVCSMRRTGEVRPDGSVDYARVRRSVGRSRGLAELRALQAAVVDGCRRQGAVTAQQFLQCYYQSAPAACDSLHAHVMVILKGHMIGA